MKKPDRFEQMGNQECEQRPTLKFISLEPIMAKLLRRQHTATVRLVNRIKALHLRVVSIAPSPECQGGIDACNDVLKAMAAYKKGQP